MTAKLTKSQRVKMIQDVCARLESEGWSTIDLVLSQFSFPTSDQWPGDKQSYIIKMVENAADLELAELAAHFGIDTGEFQDLAIASDPPFWEEGKLKVFISHLSSEKLQASQIKTALSRYGLSSFVAHNDIHPTAEWQVEIEKALSTCELLLALIHPKFVESQWCDQEIGYALGRGTPIFTVKCGADPYGFVSRFQAFNGNHKNEAQIASEVFEAALVHKKLQGRMAAILVEMFVNSDSYADAKTRVSYLEKLPAWDESYSGRVQKALADSGQISGSWGVPERVTQLLRKWK